MILFTQTMQGQEIFTPEWTNQIHAADFDFLYPQALEVDSKGNVYIACYSHDTIWINDTPILPGTGYYSNMIAKFNAAGELLWTRNYIDTYNNSSIRVTGMKINNKDELVVYGISAGVILFDGFYLSDFTDDVSIGFLHKIDTAGESVSFSQIDSIYIWDIAIGPNDEINGVAENYGTNGELFGQTVNTGNFIFQCKDNFTLNYLIEQPGPYTNPYYSNTYPSYMPHIAADNEGNTFVTYIYEDTLYLNGKTYLPHTYTEVYIDSFEIAEDSFEVFIDTIQYFDPDGVLIKYDSNGVAIWDCTINGKKTQFFHTLTVDDEGNIFTIGLFYEGDTVFIKDSTIIILPDMMPAIDKPYIVLQIDADGNPVNYMFSKDSIFLYSELVVQDQNIYVPGHIYTEETKWRNAALGRYDFNFELQQFGRASCPFTSPCYSNGDLRILAVFDSSIYAFGEYYDGMVLGEETLITDGGRQGYFLTKFPYDFSDTYIIPDSLLMVYSESSIYPIPTRDELNLSFSDKTETITNCIISNMLGQVWSMTPVQQNLNTWQLDVRFLRAGVYLVSYTVNGVEKSATFIKM